MNDKKLKRIQRLLYIQRTALCGVSSGIEYWFCDGCPLYIDDKITKEQHCMAQDNYKKERYLYYSYVDCKKDIAGKMLAKEDPIDVFEAKLLESFNE